MQPNVLFFTCHDLGKHLGCYGQLTVPAPALDKLAGQGVLLDNSFCTAPQCSPSRAALHTGRHSHTVGMLGLAHNPFNWRLHPQEKHVAQLLKESGYDTALWGVQHLTKTEGAPELGYMWYDAEDAVVPAPKLAMKAEAFLREPRRKERPFYLEVGFFEPHRPYDWGGTQPDRSRGVQVPPYLPNCPEARQEFAALQGAIRRMDEAIGQILHVLEETGLEEDTWVIFTVDHGLAMPRAKCTLYDPGIETALIMRWPAKGIAGGKRLSQLISHVDVVPTLLQGIGLAVPDNIQGRSFWPLLQGGPYQANEYVFAEKTYHTAYEPMRGIRSANYKLIANFEVDTKVSVPDDIRQGLIYPLMIDDLVGQRDFIELYDLAADPGETHNLATLPEMKDVEDALKRELVSWMRKTSDPILSGPIASSYYDKTLELLTAGF
jgi:N-sulfoglucosamine sulfohydrolase